MKNKRVVLSSARGQYIPRDFCRKFEKEMLKQFGSATILELSNPENELYWQVWEEVLDNFKLDGQVLIHDEDLFLVDQSEAENWEYI